MQKLALVSILSLVAACSTNKSKVDSATDSTKSVKTTKSGKSRAKVKELNKYVCNTVGGTEEWTIYIDLDQNKAGFFDNDSTVTVALKEMKSLETAPPQELYIFEGDDTAGAAGDKLQIAFNKTKKSAAVIINLGKADQQTLDAEEDCIKSSVVSL